jgi:hypothetical protein
MQFEISSSTQKRPMKLLDPQTGLMECSVCGARHWGMLKSGGGYIRGAWQCHSQVCPTKDGNHAN